MGGVVRVCGAYVTWLRSVACAPSAASIAGDMQGSSILDTPSLYLGCWPLHTLWFECLAPLTLESWGNPPYGVCTVYSKLSAFRTYCK